MSRLQQAIHNNIQAVEFIRDEIKLHVHLLSGELAQKRAELDQQFEALKAKAKRAAEAGADAEEDIEAALRQALDVLRDGFKRVEDSLKR